MRYIFILGRREHACVDFFCFRTAPATQSYKHDSGSGCLHVHGRDAEPTTGTPGTRRCGPTRLRCTRAPP